MQLPPEDRTVGEKHMCGKLVKAMRGPRESRQHWQDTCTGAM